MKGKLFFLALSAMALVSSCSNDDVTEVNNGNAIKFGVTTGKMNRAADVFCNNNLPGTFYVWASLAPTSGSAQTYINGDVITKSGNTWENTSGTRYWPETGTLSFYAHVNAGADFNWNDGTPTIKNFTVGTEVSGQKDLLYAVKTGQTKTVNEQAGVTLNFRHALSQIVFQAKNTNKNLYVEIDKVSICKVGDTGTFTYPTASTDNNIESHDQSGSITYDGSWGSWKKDGASTVSGNVTYGVSFTKVSIPGGVKKADKTDEIYSLTNTNDKKENGSDKEFSSNALLLLPQKTTAWDTKKKPSSKDNIDTYFLVKCAIYNVAGDEYDSENDVLLWGTSSETKEIAIPVALDWEQGKKYIYTFVFGKGNGGYDPDPDNPEPVLFPITFDVTVDDFIAASNQDVNMETKK